MHAYVNISAWPLNLNNCFYFEVYQLNSTKTNDPNYKFKRESKGCTIIIRRGQRVNEGHLSAWMTTPCRLLRCQHKLADSQTE